MKITDNLKKAKAHVDKALGKIRVSIGGYIFIGLVIYGAYFLYSGIHSVATVTGDNFWIVGKGLLALLLIILVAKGIKRYRNRKKTNGENTKVAARKPTQETGPFIAPLLQGILVNGMAWAVILGGATHLLYPDFLSTPNFLWLTMGAIVARGIFEGAVKRSRIAGPEKKKVSDPTLLALKNTTGALAAALVFGSVGWYYFNPPDFQELTARKGPLLRGVSEYGEKRALEAAIPRVPNVPLLPQNEIGEWKVNVRVVNPHLAIPAEIQGNYPLQGYITDKAILTVDTPAGAIKISTDDGPVNCGNTYKTEFPKVCAGNWTISGTPFAGTYRLDFHGSGERFDVYLYNATERPSVDSISDLKLAAYKP